METLEYITYKAMMQCTEGSAPGLFTPTYNQTTKINSCLVSTRTDKIPMTNIPSFVVCKKTQKPCVPVSTDWQQTYPVKVKGSETLIGQSCMNCGVGGKIEFMTSGQVPLSAEEEAQLNGMRDDVKEAYDKEQEEKNKPWWKKAGEFVVDCIPVVGPVVSLVKNVSEGNWGMAALDVGFLALDVVGLVGAPFTGGASVAGATVAKAGIRQAVKAGVKQVAKKASKEAIEAGAKQVARQLEKLSVRSLTRGKVCVFACFPAGTKIAVAGGHKSIEDIREGDEVWSYNEETGITSLQRVTTTLERQVHTLVTIQTEQEEIHATAEHPFYADGRWTEAGLLEAGSTLQLRNGKQVVVTGVVYHYSVHPLQEERLVVDKDHHIQDINDAGTGADTLKVYNFEVAEGHTYFVGDQEVLVHNAGGICLKQVLKEIKAGKKKMREILLGRTPGKGSKTGREVFERMKKEVPPTARIRNGKKQFKDSKGVWRDLKEADMAHKTDAVTWWNRTGRRYGARSPQVRKWMRDSNNYYLEYYGINRSQGAQLRQTYKLPRK